MVSQGRIYGEVWEDETPQNVVFHDELLFVKSIALISSHPSAVSAVKGAGAWLVLKLSPYVHYQFIANFTITSCSKNIDSFDYVSDDTACLKKKSHSA